MYEECFGNGPFIFKINENGTGPQLLTQVCLERGWKEHDSEHNENNWNLWWRTTGFSSNHHKSLYSWQYLNHIPKGSTICRKDNLIRYMRSMKRVYGSVYDFSPFGYNLPLEYTKLAAECSRSRPSKEENLVSDEKPIWICKPVAQSQGKGIFLFKKLSELSYDTNTVVQRYIEKPLLIGGYKFDLRLYVCVPSYHPLTIYMYREGLARFGTDKFSLNDLKNPFRHLTNSSINKLGPGYAEMKDRVGSGCKWTLRQLRRYFQQAFIPDWLIWQKITSLVILTILSQVQQIPHSTNCFEFFGFDVLIDSTLKPWLLEVNLSPALSNDCDVDCLVKKPMLHDMFDLLGLPLFNTGLSIFNIWLDNSEYNNRDQEMERRGSLKGTVTVLSAAGRWRRRYKRMSAPQISSRGNTSRARIRSSSANNQKTYMNLPEVQVDPGLPYTYNVPKEKPLMIESDTKKNSTWGNGRDWRRPRSGEGGWVRIWPLNGEDKLDKNNNIGGNSSSNMGVKVMVNKVMKFRKAAKDLAKKHPTASESQLTEFFQQEMDISGDIWLPPL
ncbi:probable tubulin polyglutamylase TTLL2 [Euwallacea fornicatus]|uniref:probable tubulin polyglutamylase TTLL2 n=1 Tax=Euwallacea fornicatus TaxID=995702 RepID=UPI00338DB218